jgi:hypothetical protein
MLTLWFYYAAAVSGGSTAPSPVLLQFRGPPGGQGLSFQGECVQQSLQIVLLACQLQAVLDSVAWQRLPVFLFAARCHRFGDGGLQGGAVVQSVESLRSWPLGLHAQGSSSVQQPLCCWQWLAACVFDQVGELKSSLCAPVRCAFDLSRLTSRQVPVLCRAHSLLAVAPRYMCAECVACTSASD